MNCLSNFNENNILINFLAIKSMNCMKKQYMHINPLKAYKSYKIFLFMRMREKLESALCVCEKYEVQKFLIQRSCVCA